MDMCKIKGLELPSEEKFELENLTVELMNEANLKKLSYLAQKFCHRHESPCDYRRDEKLRHFCELADNEEQDYVDYCPLAQFLSWIDERR